MNAVPRPLPEPPADRRARQLDYFRRASDHAMRAVDIAAEQLEAAHASGEPGVTAAPTLDLGRATRALVLAVNAENRVVDGIAAPRAPASDRRRPLLREALHNAADDDPGCNASPALHREIAERIEDVLLTDPDAEVPIFTHLCILASDLGITFDVAKLSDEVLGMQPRPSGQPGPHPASADTGDPFD